MAAVAASAAGRSVAVAAAAGAVLAARDSAPSARAAVQFGSTAKNRIDSGGSIRASGTR